MDYRRDDKNDPLHSNDESSHTDKPELIEHQEQKLLDQPVSQEAGRKETASALEMEQKETAVKKEKNGEPHG